MSVTVEWDNDARTILRYTFASPWTWDEYHAAIARAWELAQSVDHPTDTITDMSHSRLWPENMFHHIRRSVVEMPESTQTAVIVGAGRFAELALGVLRRAYGAQGGKFYTAHTLDEARELIRQRRERAAEG